MTPDDIPDDMPDDIPDGNDDIDLNALAATVRAATPHPDPASRAVHLQLAQDNFTRVQGAAQGVSQGVALGAAQGTVQDIARESSQETGTPARLTSKRPDRGSLQGVKAMLTTLTSRGGLTLTTALVAVGLLFLTPYGQTLLRGGQPLLAENEVPPADPAAAGDVVPVPAQGGDAVQPYAQAQAQAQAQAHAQDLDETGQIADASAAPEAAAAEPPAIAVSPSARAEADAMAPAMPEMIIAPSPNPSTAPTTLGRIAADGAIAALPGADTEAYANAAENPLKVVADAPVSTFSIDVDTASYAIVRQSLNAGQLPPPDAVRVEEMINYFPYAYPGPGADQVPFRPTVTVMDTPWNSGTDLVHIAIQGALPAIADRPPLNLVFLIDTSGSMEDPAKLPLLKQSFMLMLDNLRAEDQIAIVAYAGSSGLVLPPTAAADRQTILTAMGNLAAGGGTNGQGGLEQAYAVAADMMAQGEVARVILATDGDFNVGLSGTAELTDYIADQRDTGVFLSVLGFGRGNLDDATMQALAQNGNGTAAYIDTLNEAQKVLVDQLTGALFAIAADVKVQVEFNPAVIAEYRLIGYETRAQNREDFNNDAVDAGEIGAGLSVTAIYEVTPVGSDAVMTTPLRYGDDAATGPVGTEIGFLRLRWKEPGADDSQLLETPILLDGPPASATQLTEARFGVAIAGMGQLLRDSTFLRGWGWDQAIALAVDNRGDDSFGYRNEAVRLMRLAQSLQGN